MVIKPLALTPLVVYWSKTSTDVLIASSVAGLPHCCSPKLLQSLILRAQQWAMLAWLCGIIAEILKYLQRCLVSAHFARSLHFTRARRLWADQFAPQNCKSGAKRNLHTHRGTWSTFKCTVNVHRTQRFPVNVRGAREMYTVSEITDALCSCIVHRKFTYQWSFSVHFQCTLVYTLNTLCKCTVSSLCSVGTFCKCLCSANALCKCTAQYKFTYRCTWSTAYTARALKIAPCTGGAHWQAHCAQAI